jgi:hypothetical protein
VTSEQRPPGWVAPGYPPAYQPQPPAFQPAPAPPGFQPLSAPPGFQPAPPSYHATGYPPPPPVVMAGSGPVPVSPVPGTPFGVVYPAVPPTASGAAVGSLVAGIASGLVSLGVSCFGIAGAQPGWGAAVSGAFAILATFLGLGAIGFGVGALRQVRREAGALRGRGLAMAGISCGAVGLGITLLAMLLSFVASSTT